MQNPTPNLLAELCGIALEDGRLLLQRVKSCGKGRLFAEKMEHLKHILNGKMYKTSGRFSPVSAADFPFLLRPNTV